MPDSLEPPDVEPPDVEPGWTIECRGVVELLTDYLDEALDPATRSELDAHLAICDDCAEYLRQFRATISAVGHIPPDSLSEQAQAGLVAAFRDIRRTAR